uniref:Uncharacterized protein n=1 Tax=viral metagenome TaxID=1070528 RepID=A0A6C0L320_9ZZZZ|tara:strand:+ start:9475 stop:9918 length:444 start_codon:yes stop_codon:yes gene_type:complete
MEQVYQKNVETYMSRALPDIAYYMLAGLVCGTILESIMPKFDEEKDNVALFLEIFAQIALIVFAFMFVNAKCGGRNGLIVFILILVGIQPTLFEKIDAFRKGVVGDSEEDLETTPKFELPKKDSEEEEETETLDNSGSTSIDKLPNV